MPMQAGTLNHRGMYVSVYIVVVEGNQHNYNTDCNDDDGSSSSSLCRDRYFELVGDDFRDEMNRNVVGVDALLCFSYFFVVRDMDDKQHYFYSLLLLDYNVFDSSIPFSDLAANGVCFLHVLSLVEGCASDIDGIWTC